MEPICPCSIQIFLEGISSALGVTTVVHVVLHLQPTTPKMAPGRVSGPQSSLQKWASGEGADPFWAQFATFHFIKPCLTLLASVWQTQLRTSLSIPWGSSMSNLSSSVPLPERETREQSAEASPGVVNAANVQTTGAPCEERTKALTRLVVRGRGSQMPTERVVSFLLFIR